MRNGPARSGAIPVVMNTLGVIDGARTRDIRLHKPALYQLSYDHHAGLEEAA